MTMEESRRELQQVGRKMLDLDLAWGNAGNLSARIAPNRFLITATGTRLGELTEDDFAEVGLDGKVFGERKPSKEVPMHRAVYELRPEINVVLHSSPFYSTLIACSKLDIPANYFIESMYYLERVERVPYAHAGSQKLGDRVREKAIKANVLLLENHGILVYDVNMREALMALQTLEYTCRMLITARSAGIELEALSPEIAQDFLNNAAYKARRQWSS